MMQGKVKWFNDDKGFGFIVSEGQEYFAHFKEIRCEGFKSLKDNDIVEFIPAKGEKGMIAKDITRVV